MANRTEAISEAAAGQAGVTTLWYTRCPIPTASSLAINHGWLDEEFRGDGIEVASLRASADMRVRESHFDHSQAHSFRQGGTITPIWARSRGADTKLIGISWVDEFQAILALPESGISSVKDLRGRRLGLPRRVNDQIDYWRATCLRGYLSALALEGMDERDVDLVDLPVEEQFINSDEVSHSGTLWSGGHRARRQQIDAFALIRGEVDAIHTAGAPGACIAAFLGARTVIDVGRHPDPSVRVNNQPPCILTVSGDLLREHPDLVTRYVKRLRAAARWAETHRAETVRIVGNDVSATDEWVDVAHGPDFHRDLGIGLSESGIAAVESQKDFLLRWGFLKDDFDVRAWIDAQPLQALGAA